MINKIYNRLISLPKNGGRSFFIWGGRKTGKSTLLREIYPESSVIDLLKSDTFARYATKPYLLREELSVKPKTNLVIIDEIQKIPELLDEVHWMIENQKRQFGMSGSSARKIKQGQANLLGGRALRYELFGFVSAELERDFDLNRILNRGYIPDHYLCEEWDYKRLMQSYVGDYLKEEIAGESLVRNLTHFSDFLTAASICDTEQISFTSFARDVGVSANTIKEYFTILVDTLHGWWLPSFSKRLKRRVVSAPKFYFADLGVVNHLAKRGKLEPGGELYGKALENWLGHELRAYNHYRDKFLEISFWRLSSGVEVDFIIGDIDLAVEVKASDRARDDHYKGLRELIKDFPQTKRRILVNLESNGRQTSDGIEIIPAMEFVARLWRGEFF